MWFYAGAAAIGRRIREEQEAYENYLHSLEPIKQRLINDEYRGETIESLMREDPKGILTLLCQETSSGRINKDIERKIWKTAFNMLPKLKREDLIEEAERMMAGLYLQHQASFWEDCKYNFLLPFRMFFFPPPFFKGHCHRLCQKYAKRYIAE